MCLTCGCMQAHKAAGMKEAVGGRLATKGHEIASGLRSERATRFTPTESGKPDESSTGLDRPSSS